MGMTIRDEYRRERARVRNLLNRMEKQGFIGAKDLLPDIPKRPTRASINRMSKITRRSVAEKLPDFINYATGEVVGAKRAYLDIQAHRDPFRERPQPERAVSVNVTVPQLQPEEQPQRNAAEIQPDEVMPYTEPLIDNLVSDIKEAIGTSITDARGVNEDYRDAILNEIYRLSEQDAERLAKNIEEHSESLNRLIETVVYDSDQTKIEVAYARIMTYLRGAAA